MHCISPASRGLSLVVVGGGYSLIAVRELLILVISLVERQGLQDIWASVAAALESRFSRCGAWALVDPQHVGWSQTKDRTRVPCSGRQIPIHCTTREVLFLFLKVE